MNRPVVDNDLLAACHRAHSAGTVFWGGLLAVSLGALLYVALGFGVTG